MKPFEIKKDIYWIGALHPDLRLFDIIMATKNGTTYNSYLIRDEKTVIIDTVKEKFAEQYIDNIRTLVDPAKIDFIIMQHNEPDHSGSLQQLLQSAPQAQVVCAKPAVKYVQNILNRDINVLAVGNQETIRFGSTSLHFLSAPYCHWPDTMMTWLEQEHILFPCDIMGAHFCDSRMFNDMISRDFWPDFKYYFDSIMRPYKKNVGNAIKKLDDLDVQLIAPSHGPIVRTDTRKYIAAYKKWTEPPAANDPRKMLIYYASAHGNTGLMAEKIAAGAASRGVDVSVYDAVEIDAADHVDRIEQADALLLGSPTLNNSVVKPIWDVLNALITIDVKGKIAGSFGSYGWSGDAVDQIDSRLNAMKFKVPFAGQKAVLVPDEHELQACFEFGAKIADIL